MVQEANSSYKASRAKGQITPPSPIQNVVKMLTAHWWVKKHGTTHRFNLFLSRMRLRSFLLCFKATTISFSTNWLFLLFDHFPIGLLLLICSITLQMKRVSLLSFFFQNMCSIWAIFQQPTVSLPPTHFPQTARVAFPKCQSDCVTLLPTTASCHLDPAQTPHLVWGTCPFEAQLSTVRPTGPPDAAVRVMNSTRGNDIWKKASGAPPGGEQQDSLTSGCPFP